MNTKAPPTAGPPHRDSPQSAQALLREALDATPDNAAVLDAHGTIVITNIAWRQYPTAYSPKPGQITPFSDVGVNYLEVAARGDDPQGTARQALQGIRDVLSGKIEAFSLVYPCHTPEEQFWFTMTVTPMEWEGERGALVMHTDTTPRHHLSRR
ncbi:PAS domain-containing protein [Rhodoferax antarcticus]|uniref:PAS domain-containing protein n=1 Tax=Rhodoferax antarcticus TaxID=81479 RepID=UPI00222553FE|nr:PAS domain-containing protein [Rhodoferax antarcticus]MCW2312284.1 PAS domain-containing protein [Rhodoferax antarcticus]